MRGQAPVRAMMRRSDFVKLPSMRTLAAELSSVTCEAPHYYCSVLMRSQKLNYKL